MSQVEPQASAGLILIALTAPLAAQMYAQKTDKRLEQAEKHLAWPDERFLA